MALNTAVSDILEFEIFFFFALILSSRDSFVFNSRLISAARK